MKNYLEKLFDSKKIDLAVGRVVGKIQNGPLNGKYVRTGGGSDGGSGDSGSGDES